MTIERNKFERRVHFRITDWCNFKCSYCVQGLERQPEKVEDLDFLVKHSKILRNHLDWLDEIAPVPTEELELIGGEISTLDLKAITEPLIKGREEKIARIQIVSNLTGYKNLADYSKWLDSRGVKFRLIASFHEEFMKPEVFFDRLYYLKANVSNSTTLNPTFVVHDDNIEYAELFQNKVKDDFPMYAINCKRERQKDANKGQKQKPYVTEKTINWLKEHYGNERENFASEYIVNGEYTSNRVLLTNGSGGRLDTVGWLCSDRHMVVRYAPNKGLRFGCGLTADKFNTIICPQSCSLCSAQKISNNSEDM